MSVVKNKKLVLIFRKHFPKNKNLLTYFKKIEENRL